MLSAILANLIYITTLEGMDPQTQQYKAYFKLLSHNSDLSGTKTKQISTYVKSLQ